MYEGRSLIESTVLCNLHEPYAKHKAFLILVILLRLIFIKGTWMLEHLKLSHIIPRFMWPFKVATVETNSFPNSEAIESPSQQHYLVFLNEVLLIEQNADPNFQGKCTYTTFANHKFN